MAGEEREELSPTLAVHRLGGARIENLRLKPEELLLVPPGVSVFLGGTPQEAAAQMRQTFRDAKKYARLHAAAAVVASASAATIRQAGFEVIAAPTLRFANHARIIHPQGSVGFTDSSLAELSQVFQETTGC